MGGLKRKIQTDAKIEKKESKSVAFSKRRKGLYSKASQLCVLSGAQVAILATPPCSKSNVSFYSFGHSSVDSVVSAFLKNQYPRGDHLCESEYWWEDKGLAESEDPKELSEAVDSVSRMIQNLKGLRSKALANREDAKKKKKEVVSDQSETLILQSACASSSCIHEDQPENLPGLVIKEEDQKVAVSDQSKTLNLQSACASSSCIHEDPPENLLGLVENIKEEDQKVAVSDKNNNEDVVIQGTHQELDGNQTLEFQPSVASICIQDVSPENVEVSVNNGEQKDQIVASSDSSNNNSNGLLGNLDGFDQVLTLDDDDFIDFEMNSEGFITTSLETDHVSTSQYSCSGSEGAEDGAMVVVHSNSKKDDQMVAVSDSDNALPGDVYGCNQEFDVDQIFDLVASSEELSVNSEMMDDVSMVMSTNKNQTGCSNSEAVEHGAVALHKDLEEDNLHFSDFFNSLFTNGELLEDAITI